MCQLERMLSRGRCLRKGSVFWKRVSFVRVSFDGERLLGKEYLSTGVLFGEKSIFRREGSFRGEGSFRWVLVGANNYFRDAIFRGT